MTPPAEVVVLRALGLGDLLTAVPALRALQRHFAGWRRVLLAPAALAEPVLALAHVEMTVVDCRGLDGAPPLAPQVAVNLHGRGPESHRLLLTMRPDRLVAFSHPRFHPSGPAWDPDEHEVHRWCRLLQAHGIAADPSALTLDPPAAPARVDTTIGATVIHPGAKDAARRWPVRRWAQVAEFEHAAGREVVITGSAEERPAGLTVAELAGLPARRVLAGETSIRCLAALVSRAEMLVCGDTGVAHLATALATPSVLLFGPTDPARWGPPASPSHTVLWKGRTGDPHALVPNAGLLKITVDEVIGAMDRIRKRGSK